MESQCPQDQSLDLEFVYLCIVYYVHMKTTHCYCHPSRTKLTFLIFLCFLFSWESDTFWVSRYMRSLWTFLARVAQLHLPPLSNCSLFLSKMLLYCLCQFQLCNRCLWLHRSQFYALCKSECTQYFLMALFACSCERTFLVATFDLPLLFLQSPFSEVFSSLKKFESSWNRGYSTFLALRPFQHIVL